MIDKIRKFLKQIFSKNKKMMLCDHNTEAKTDLEETTKSEFLINLVKETYLNQDDGNGYGIVKDVEWENLI